MSTALSATDEANAAVATRTAMLATITQALAASAPAMDAPSLASLLGIKPKALGFESLPVRVIDKALTAPALNTQSVTPTPLTINQLPGCQDAATIIHLSAEGIGAVKIPGVTVQRSVTGVDPSLAQALDPAPANAGLSADDALALMLSTQVKAVWRIQLAPGTVLTQPLYLWLKPSHACERIEIDCGARSQALIIQLTSRAAQPLGLTHTEVVVHEQSHIKHVCIDANHADTVVLNRLVSHVQRDASYAQLQLDVGAKFSRVRRDAHLLAAGATATLNAILNVHAAKESHLYTHVTHHVPQTHSAQTTRGLGQHKGTGSDQSIVRINRHAHGARSTQSSRHLLLDPTAALSARPILEIFNDDVKAAHGSTVGTLDPAMAFYLRARGLSQACAERLLVRAFWHEALVGFNEFGLSDWLDSALHLTPQTAGQRA